MPAVAGPFYFAKVDAGVPFDDAVHNVMDFYIFSFNLQQAETEFASLEIEIENPGVDGLLDPAQPIWGWFSWDNGSEIVPLFYGRLIAIPTNLLATSISLKFVARPDDYEAQRSDIAAAIRAAGPPFWDGIFIDAAHREDVDAVLEAIAADWHTDRIFLEVSLSDIIEGEDGTVTFLSGEAFFDALDVKIAETPVQFVNVEASVPWKQAFHGTIYIGKFVWYGIGANSVAQAWPNPGDQLSGGWSCENSTAEITMWPPEPVSWQKSFQNGEKTHRNGDTMSIQMSYSGVGGAGIYDKYNVTIGDPETGTPAHTEVETHGNTLWATGGALTSITLAYGADRDRTEKITIRANSHLQNVLRSDLEEQAPEIISRDAQEPVETDGSQSASYFMTARGDQSVQYLVMLAVARLKLGARIVSAEWDTTFAKATELTLRKSAALFDPRLQHGQILGKITGYVMEGNGDTGQFKGTCKIGATVGLADVLSESAGTPTYCEEDYVDQPYQVYEDVVTLIGGAGDVSYSPPIVVPNDDGLIFPLTRDQAVRRLEVHNNEFVEPEAQGRRFERPGGSTPGIEGARNLIDEQRKIMEQSQEEAMLAQYKNLLCWLELEMIDLTSTQFGSAVETVADLVLPKQYDVTSP